MSGRASGSGSSVATVIAIAAAAYVSCDMIHEVLGHGLACALSPGVRALSLTTVALQTDASSRWVAAAGSIANVVAGLAAFALFRRRTTWDGWTLFLALLAATDLFNGTGYLIFSAALDIGDWAVVIAGTTPPWLWRTILGLTGIALYGMVVAGAARASVVRIRQGLISPREPGRVLLLAYVAGGLLFVAGAAMNPIGPSLILTSGVSSGFGAMAGLAALPSLIERRTTGAPEGGRPLPFSLGWCVAGAVAAALFVGVIGPGIRL